jgi:Protein of unknown function (DUF3843)
MNLEKHININDWISRKPYKKILEYDLFYLNIWREVFTLISKSFKNGGHSYKLDDNELKEIAYVFTAFFEDRVCEIGFYESLITLNKKTIGKRVPFYSNEIIAEYEEQFDDILPCDIHYLAFISVYSILDAGTKDDEMVTLNFGSAFMLEWVEILVNYFNEIEEVSVTPYYKEFLKKPSNFVEFKMRLAWFTFHSYLHSIEFGNKLKKFVDELSKEISPNEPTFGYITYTYEDSLIFENPSKQLAYYPLEIFANSLLISEADKKNIVSLKYRPEGIFHIQQETKTHYTLLHTATGDEFTVNKATLTNPLASKEYEFWKCKLALWEGEYCISGSCVNYSDEHTEIKENNLKNQLNYNYYSKKYRDELLATSKDMFTSFYAFFGKKLVTFSNAAEMEKKMSEYYAYDYDLKAKKNTSKPAVDKALKFEIIQSLKHEKDITVFCDETSSLSIFQYHANFISLLTMKDLNKANQNEINSRHILYSTNINLAYFYYIYDNYNTLNLNIITQSIIETRGDFEAFLRIYNPNSFSVKNLPKYTLVDSSKTDINTLKTNFFNQ